MWKGIGLVAAVGETPSQRSGVKRSGAGVTRTLLAVLLMAGCAARGGLTPNHRFEARPTLGEIRVVPVVHAYDVPTLRIDGYVAERVTLRRQIRRQQRMGELAQVPDAVGMAVPGAIHRLLADEWTGHFLVGHYPMGARDRIEHVLRTKNDAELEVVLGDVAKGVGGHAVLMTWIEALQADPLTAEAFPGEMVQTSHGQIMVDFREEPYRVRATIGLALVATDGQVILRYTDHFEDVLTDHRSPNRVGRDLARGMAREVVKMWPDDPRLWRRPSTLAVTDAGD